MNTIAALSDQCDYNAEWFLLNFCLDGYWLDEKLDELYPGQACKGLIPTLDFALYGQAERKIVWARILPAEGETAICPLLMCPDDVDFSCTLVVAEIQNLGSTVRWRRLGLDRTQEWEPQAVGTTVEWFTDFSELVFAEPDYLQMVADFREQFGFNLGKYGSA